MEDVEFGENPKKPCIHLALLALCKYLGWEYPDMTWNWCLVVPRGGLWNLNYEFTGLVRPKGLATAAIGHVLMAWNWCVGVPQG
ncbi:hypothetical protein TNCV_854481 [Trichonephila clavipes]|nr:hypothetical protein TNCV_854481 [Trichonephila clavipes]